MKLRDYQETLILQVREKFAKGKKKVIMQAPTGAGKTVTFVELTRRTLEKNPESAVLIFTNRVELMEQARKTLESAGIPVNTISAGKKSPTSLSAGATVAMVETFSRRTIGIEKLKLVIVDEAHIGNFRKILPQFEGVHVIGATATPLSAKKDLPLKDDYEDIVCGIGIPELIEQKFLSNPEYFHLVPKQIHKLRVEKGEYSDESQLEVFEDVELFSDLIREFSKFSDKKTIVFCNNQSTTELVCKQFQNAGYKADFVISGGKNDRNEVFDNFKTGKIQILVNCGIATTGYDEPSIQCVILYRATKSYPLFLQMIGRGSRITETKKDFIILDFGQNLKNHGYWDWPINWEHIFFNPPKKGESPAPVKDCPNCGAKIPINAMVCPFCDFDLEKQKDDKTQVESVLVKIERATQAKIDGRRPSQLNVDELILLQKLKNYKTGFILRVLRSKEDPIKYLKEFQKKMGYHHKWVNYQQFGEKEFNDKPITF